MRDRTKAREWALLVLYAWESRGPDAELEAILQDFLTRRRIGSESRVYLRRLIDAVQEDMGALDAEIQRSVANWRLERVAVVDRNILRIAATEMMRFEDIPPRVSIQEALGLAEKYGADQSPRFVNGVLDGLMRQLGR